MTAELDAVLSERNTPKEELEPRVVASVFTGLLALPTSPVGVAVTCNVEAFNVAVPEVLVERAPATSIVPPVLDNCRVSPLATDEVFNVTALEAPCESLRNTLCVEFEVTLVAFVFTGTPELPTSPAADELMFNVGVVSVVVPVAEI